MDPWSREPAGRFDEHVLESEALRGNPLGDPHRRPLWVYVPPGYDEEAERRYPTIYMIQGLTGQLDMWRNRPPMRPTFPELADRGIASGEIPPCIVVWVDCWTSLGGSQFLDSPGTGNYLTYLCDEVVPWVDGRSRRHRPVAVRPGHGPADPRGVGAVAGPRPGAHGPGPRGGAPLDVGHLHRRREARRGLPRPRRRSVPSGPGRGRRDRGVLRDLRCGPRGDRVPLSAGAAGPRRAARLSGQGSARSGRNPQ